MTGLKYEIEIRTVLPIKHGEIIYEKRLEDLYNLPDMNNLKEEITTADA